jgi:hypothetical protein
MRDRDGLIHDIRKNLLRIWALGDRDEMSWKHIGHSTAWELGADYNLPKTKLSPKQLGYLGICWLEIEFAIDHFGKQNFIDAIPEIADGDSRLIYLGQYLTDSWLGYQQPIVAQGLTLKGEEQ